jgi:hypothetical protein
MKKIFGAFLIGATLVLSLSSCSSDPFKNAGKCKNLAATKTIDGKLAICTGLKYSYKWYFDGDSYDAIKAIGFIEASKANVGLETGTYEAFYNAVIAEHKSRASELFDYLFSSANLESSIQVAAKGNQRWDELVAAISAYVNKSSEADAAFKEQLSIFNDAMKANNYKGKLPYSQKYVDAQKLHFQLSGEAEKLRENAAPLLQVFESYLQNEVGLKEPLKAARALASFKVVAG